MKRKHSQATLRETFVILGAWCIFCAWTLGWTACYGFSTSEPGENDLALGMPSWVTWGIALPWLIATGFTTWFCLFYMQDDIDVAESSRDPREGSTDD